MSTTNLSDETIHLRYMGSVAAEHGILMATCQNLTCPVSLAIQVGTAAEKFATVAQRKRKVMKDSDM